MNKDILFGGLPDYKPIAWTTLVMHEEPAADLISQLDALKTVARVAGVTIKTNRYMPKDKVLVTDDSGTVVGFIDLVGD